MKSSLIATRLEYIYRAEGRAEHTDSQLGGKKTYMVDRVVRQKHTHVHTHEYISQRKVPLSQRQDMRLKPEKERAFIF